MNATIITIYTVYETFDEWGRRGACLGTYSKESNAKKRAEGKGFFGSNGEVVEERAVVIGDKVYALKSDKPIDLDDAVAEQNRKLVEQARAKLTAEEAKALGLD